MLKRRFRGNYHLPSSPARSVCSFTKRALSSFDQVEGSSIDSAECSTGMAGIDHVEPVAQRHGSGHRGVHRCDIDSHSVSRKRRGPAKWLQLSCGVTVLCSARSGIASVIARYGKERSSHAVLAGVEHKALLECGRCHQRAKGEGSSIIVKNRSASNTRPLSIGVGTSRFTSAINAVSRFNEARRTGWGSIDIGQYQILLCGAVLCGAMLCCAVLCWFPMSWALHEYEQRRHASKRSDLIAMASDHKIQGIQHLPWILRKNISTPRRLTRADLIALNRRNPCVGNFDIGPTLTSK
ncbi:hypothetical protein KC328_g119 [Hortaea werneckii]|nr:hypothetical protein KC328_g119 [Hortaea werneckii]